MRKIVIIGALAALAGIISGCGLKGDLYLPDNHAAAWSALR